MRGTPNSVGVIFVIIAGAMAMVITAALLVIGVISLWISQYKTQLIAPQDFDGIMLKKENTSVIIVHGIGPHCIGYADELISNLFKQLTERPSESIIESYRRYAKQIVADLSGREPQTRSSDGALTVTWLHPLRNGSCQVVEDIQYDIDPGRVNRDDDLETVTLSQDYLCRSINEDAKARGDTSNSNKVAVTCHKLYVKRDMTRYKNRYKKQYKKENPEYVTGFIRRFSTDLIAGSSLRIYEVTWSPATRWIKRSLIDLERFNDPHSVHELNSIMKSEVINAGIADAVAYLADSGVLVNYDILQAFCLTLANADSLHEKYDFACDRSHLLSPAGDFSKDNDVYLISHSLGTRVLFDSIGMLSLGVDSPKPGEDTALKDQAGGPSEPTLLTAIADKFGRIGAIVPEEYTSTSGAGPSFSSALNERIPQFAKSIRSIYVFTNQVPLLAANLTTPFQGTSDVGVGFQRFLELRNPDNLAEARLPIVSFHDPDDVLSYNLGCWYYQTVLKESDGTKRLIEMEAEREAKRKLGNRDCSLHTEQASFDKFRERVGAEKELCALLIARTDHDPKKWRIARLDYGEELLDTVIKDISDELVRELEKQPLDEEKVVELVHPAVLKSAIGHENRTLRETLFRNNCSEVKLNTVEHRQLFSKIWGGGQIKLVDAAVRLKGKRVYKFAADPVSVHSNYFSDETVHGWLAKGKDRAN